MLSVLVSLSVTAAWMEHPKVGGSGTRNPLGQMLAMEPPGQGMPAGAPGSLGRGLITLPPWPSASPFGLPRGPGLPGRAVGPERFGAQMRHAPLASAARGYRAPSQAGLVGSQAPAPGGPVRPGRSRVASPLAS
jgi:hypothetical protein